MSETTPLIKAALNLRVGVGFDVYVDQNNNTPFSEKCSPSLLVQSNMNFYIFREYLCDLSDCLVWEFESF